MIYDLEQVKQFHSLLKPLEKDEVYFISMSGRNKYLTEEERIEFDLGRSEMMGRKIVKSSNFEDYVRILKSYEHSWYGRGGKELPSKCLICYVNINTCSSKKALKEFYSKTTELLFNLDTNSEYYERLRFIDTELMNCFQRSISFKKWLDIDFDSPDKEFSYYQVCRFTEELKEHNVENHTIDTHSGFHVLLNRSNLSYNYTKMIDLLDKQAKEKFDKKAEVVRNSNEMVPVPGTLQGEYKVKIIDNN